MGASLIRNGHREVFSYRIGFVKTAVEEINDSTSNQIRYNSLAHRLSKLDAKDYGKIMNENEPKQKPIVDHVANMIQSKGK